MAGQMTASADTRSAAPGRADAGSTARPQYYLYAIDADFGPFFLKFGSYFPYTAKLCINGHEYVKRQLAKAGIAFEALERPGRDRPCGRPPGQIRT
jgi:hypothetical protein